MSYYKIVSKDLKSYFSSWPQYDIKNPHLIIQYKIGQFVRPILKYSQLFVYDDISEAKRNMERDKHRLFECEIINPRRPKLCQLFLSWSDFWKNNKNKKKISHLRFYSNNAVGCDAVKLVKEIL